MAMNLCNLIAIFWMLVVSHSTTETVQRSGGQPQVPCFFIFGDSLVDAGNNNNLSTLAKVNYSPYGVDFPHGPTGRFTNGRTSVDVLGEYLGYDDFIPAFATVTDPQILKGVNYASGSAGILYESGKHMGANVDLDQQLKNHETVVSRIHRIFRNNKPLAASHLNKCLYYIAIGNNDYINNYFMPHSYNSSKLHSTHQFSSVLIRHFSQQLMTLYKYGARKVALTGSSAIGCTPYATAMYGTKGSLCVDNMNSAANIFNRQLKVLADQLNKQLQGAQFTHLGFQGPMPASFNKQDMNIKFKGCCEVDNVGQCIPNENVCKNKDLHIFWDSFHPTEMVNIITGKLAYLSLINIL